MSDDRSGHEGRDMAECGKYKLRFYPNKPSTCLGYVHCSCTDFSGTEAEKVEKFGASHKVDHG